MNLTLGAKIVPLMQGKNAAHFAKSTTERDELGGSLTVSGKTYREWKWRGPGVLYHQGGPFRNRLKALIDANLYATRGV